MILLNKSEGNDVNLLQPENVLSNIRDPPDTDVAFGKNNPVGNDVNPVQPENVLANRLSAFPDTVVAFGRNNPVGNDVNPVQS